MPSSPKTLQQVASELGGKVKGDKVEYQVRGKGYKATRYITASEIASGYSPNTNPYSSRPDGKGEKNGPNGVYGKPITPAALMKPGVATIPGTPTPQNPGNVVNANNVALATNGNVAGMGYSLDQKGQYTYTAPSQDQDIFSAIQKGYQDAIGQVQADMPSAVDTMASVEKAARLREKERAVQTYTNQINNITTQAQAESLALEGQGRGITESIIGGQSAKINREAAIQALPIQAQLAAASGDLESARSFVTQKFQLLQQDAQQQYQFKMKLVESVKDFATAQEQRKLDALGKKEDQAFQLKMKNLSFQQEKELLSYKAGLEAAETSSPASPLQLANMEVSVGEIGGLLADKDDYLKTAVGTFPIFGRTSLGFDWFTGGRSKVISSVEQLRSQLTVDKLAQAKGQGVTFGALSDDERQTVAAAATQLGTWAITDKNGKVTGYKASETDFKNELQKISNLKTLDYILQGGDPTTVGGRVYPDGTVWVQNWDGTLTQVY